jgi:NAD(P)-dependent dehydrogenase (short-subunit alcohol dehydrogenase family)
MTEHRVALVTGGAYGIGRGVVQEFARKGDAVVIADRDADRGAVLESSLRARGSQVLFVQTDIRIEQQIQALIAKASMRSATMPALSGIVGLTNIRWTIGTPFPKPTCAGPFCAPSTLIHC